MKTIPTVEESVKPFDDEYEEVGSDLTNEEYWKVRKLALKTITQDRANIKEVLLERMEEKKIIYDPSKLTCFHDQGRMFAHNKALEDIKRIIEEVL